MPRSRHCTASSSRSTWVRKGLVGLLRRVNVSSQPMGGGEGLWRGQGQWRWCSAGPQSSPTAPASSRCRGGRPAVRPWWSIANLKPPGPAPTSSESGALPVFGQAAELWRPHQQHTRRVTNGSPGRVRGLALDGEYRLYRAAEPVVETPCVLEHLTEADPHLQSVTVIRTWEQIMLPNGWCRYPRVRGGR